MRKRFKWMIPLMLSLGLATTVVPVAPGFSGSQVVYADGDDKDKDSIDSSLASKASDIANIFNQGLAALGSEDEKDVEKANKLLDLVRQNPTSATNPGNAGGALGYSDNPTGTVSLGTKLQNWINAKVSANSISYSYKSLGSIPLSPNAQKNGGSSMSFAAYGYYGKALTEGGFMKMSDLTGIGMIMGLARAIGGMIILVFYLLAIMVPVLFALVLKLMIMFNPFVWLAKGLTSTGSLLYKAVGAEQSWADSYFATASEMFSGIYETLSSFGLLSLAILLGWVVFTIFAGYKARNAKTNLKKIVLRLCIAVLGVPIIGGSYTATLNWLHTQSLDNESASYINYVIASSFVRVDSWIENTRLAPPTANGTLATGPGESLIRYNVRDEMPSKTSSDLRKVASSINVISAKASDNRGYSAFAATLQDSLNKAGGGASSIGAVTSESDYEVERASLDSTDMNLGVDFSRIFNSGSVGWVTDTLIKFINSSKYTAGTYDSFVKGTISSKDGLKAANGLLSLNFNVLDNVGDTANDQDKDIGATSDLKKGTTGYILYDASGIKDAGDGDEGKAFNTGYKSRGFNFYNNGAMSASPVGGFFNSDDVAFYLNGGSSSPMNGSLERAHLDSGENFRAHPNFGLSDLALYNFLSTNFGGSGMVVYSSSNSTSLLTLGQYQNVVMPGRGFDVFMLWIETVTVLAVFIIVGVLFWYEMMTKVFTAFIGIAVNAFGTVVGSLNFFMKMCLYAGVGILQLVMSMVFYQMIVKILIGMVGMASTLAANAGSISLPLGVVGLDAGASIMSALARILSIALLLATAFSACYVYKKHVAQAIMEFFTEWINKITNRLENEVGGDGSISQKLQAAGKTETDKAGKSDYRDALEHEKALDREERKRGGKGRSNAELRAAAVARAAGMKKAKMADTMTLKGEDDPLSRQADVKEARKDELEQSKEMTNEYRKNAREMARQSKLMSTRDKNVAKAVNAYSKKAEEKGWTSLNDGFGDTDGDGTPRDAKSGMSNEDIAGRAGVKNFDDLHEKNAEIKAATSETQNARKEAASKTAGLQQTANQAQKRLTAAKAKASKTESRLASAQAEVDVASEEYSDALATGNSATISAAKAKMTKAESRLSAVTEENAEAVAEVEAATGAAESAEKALDDNQASIVAMDRDLSTFAKKSQQNHRIAKHLVEKHGMTSKVAGHEKQVVDSNGVVSTQKVFSDNVDAANSNLTSLRNSMVELQGLAAQYDDFKASGDEIGAQRVAQQIQHVSSGQQQVRQNLANMGFDNSQMETVEQVNDVANTFNSEFNRVAGEAKESVVLTQSVRNATATDYGSRVLVKAGVQSAVSQVVQTAASAPVTAQTAQMQQIQQTTGVVNQIATTAVDGVAAVPNIVDGGNNNNGGGNNQNITRNRVIAGASISPLSNDTTSTIHVNDNVQVVNGDASVGVDTVNVVQSQNVTATNMNGTGGRRQVVNRTTGGSNVTPMANYQSGATGGSTYTPGVGGSTFTAPSGNSQGGTRNLGAQTISRSESHTVQNNSDTVRTINDVNNVNVQHQTNGTDYVDVRTDTNVTQAQMQNGGRRQVVRRTGGGSSGGGGILNTSIPTQGSNSTYVGGSGGSTYTPPAGQNVTHNVGSEVHSRSESHTVQSNVDTRRNVQDVNNVSVQHQNSGTDYVDVSADTNVKTSRSEGARRQVVNQANKSRPGQTYSSKSGNHNYGGQAPLTRTPRRPKK